jgi:hydroxyethylthiazole kinase
MEKNLWKHVETVRTRSPLVHNITNYVVMNNTANALLAVGASPIMAHAHSEVQDMTSICQSLVINIGTLDEYWVKSMLLAAEKAHQLNKPWVLDPVGAGATSYRNNTISALLGYKPTVIRGNASEIMALAKDNTNPTKGVDSTAESNEAVAAAKMIADEYKTLVCISGKTDIIVGNDTLVYIDNGDALMTKVTGLGCSATAVIGAFIAVIDNKVEALVVATALFSIAGELAAKECTGPGSLQMNLLDKLHNITEEEFSQTLRIS